jgi:flavin-dependent dehydrogenase
VIVGAGPAGLAAGIVLARNGVKTLVCEQRSMPLDKACGEGVLPHGVTFLRQLGALRHLATEESRPFVGIRLQTADGTSAAARFVEGPGLGIRRIHLCRSLNRAAQDWRGLEVRQLPVLGFGVAKNSVVVRLPNQWVHAHLLIGADGLNSRVRRWAGLDGGRGKIHRYGARQHFQTAAWSDHVEVHYGPGIEAYVTPCARETVGVAFLWDKARYRPRLCGNSLISALLGSFPQLEERLRLAPRTSQPLSFGPLHCKARGRCSDGVLLLGDAGGYLDACTGEGISLALGQALSLERSLVPLLKRTARLVGQTQLRPAAAACRDITRPYYLATRLLLFLNRHPVLLDRFLRIAGKSPDFLAHLFSAQMGQSSFWPGWSRLLQLMPILWDCIARQEMWLSRVRSDYGHNARAARLEH